MFIITLGWIAIDEDTDPHCCFKISGEVMLVKLFSKISLICQLKRNIHLLRLYLLKYMSAFASASVEGIQLFVSKQIKVILVLESIAECESKAGFCSQHIFSRNLAFSGFTFLYCFYFLLSIFKYRYPLDTCKIEL